VPPFQQETCIDRKRWIIQKGKARGVMACMIRVVVLDVEERLPAAARAAAAAA
jgi:hypothetical protein